MAQILTNSWVVGIGGGIFSGLFVWALSRYVLSRSENREITQKILAAKREVLYAIRPGIAEDRLPSREVVQALIESTARKYEIDLKMMSSTEQFADDLIKEVMDSSFISVETKAKYCARLAELSADRQGSDENTGLLGLGRAYRQGMQKVLSLTLAGTTAVTTALAVVLNVRPQAVEGHLVVHQISSNLLHFEPVLLGTLSGLLALTFLFTTMLHRKERPLADPLLKARERKLRSS